MKNQFVKQGKDFILGFGQKSKFDQVTEGIFKKYKAKLKDDEEQQTYFSLIKEFDKVVLDLDKPFVWEKC